MYTKIELSDKACLWESYLGRLVVKFFTFEYEGITIKHKYDYRIIYNPVNHKDKFKVDIGGFDSRIFDTLLEAKEFVYKHVKETKERLDKEQEELKEFIGKTNKRKRKKEVK